MEENRNPIPPTTVWMSCRATPECEGKQSLVLSSRPNIPIGRITIGSFDAAQGGSSTRYRCLTCNQEFTIST